MIPVHVIGLGMSARDLPARSLEIIKSAEVLVGGRRHLTCFPDHPARKIELSAGFQEIFMQIRELAETEQVVVLASGDPNFYGVGPLLVDAIGAENVVLHPNITAVQAAFARLKMSWHDVEVVSLHARGWEELDKALYRAEKLAVYTDPEHSPGRIAEYLMTLGMDSARICVLEDLGMDSERVTWLEAEEATGQEFSALNLVAIFRGPVSDAGSKLHLGTPEDAFIHQAGLITKAEVRAVVLGALALGPGQVLWDLGAGCGSVGLEASLLVHKGRIVAVEKDPERVEQIRLNGRRFNVQDLTVVCGQAPECLDGLPSPDRVFVGGGGVRIEAILKSVIQRLGLDGRLVLTAVLFETLERARMVLYAAGWDVEVIQLQVSRGRKMGQGMRLEALNPVWILKGIPSKGRGPA